MKQVGEIILCVFVFAWLTYLGVDLINGQQAATAAETYKSDIVKEISESNFSADVINACGVQACQNGYTMEITLYDEDGGKNTYSYTDGTNQLSSSEHIVMAEVLLDYKYSIPILNIEKEHTRRGYIR